MNARYDKGAVILTSNRPQQLLDRLLHHTIVIKIEGSSYRLRQHAALVPENVRLPTRRSPSAAAARLEGPTTIPIAAGPGTTIAVTQGNLDILTQSSLPLTDVHDLRQVQQPSAIERK